MSLTEEQIGLVKDSWAIVAQNVKQNGVDFYLALFAAYPHYQDLFTKLKGLSVEELKTSPKMRGHASIVMFNLTSMISNLDDPECFSVILDKTVRDHRPRNVTTEHFENLGKVLVSFLGEKLGDKFDTKTKEAWVLAYSIIMSVVRNVNNEQNAQNGNV